MFQWTAPGGLAQVQYGATPMLGNTSQFDNSTTATYAAADMLGPRANASGYFWPGAPLLGVVLYWDPSRLFFVLTSR